METSEMPHQGRPTMDPLTTSDRIDLIAAALAIAQTEIEGADKSAVNPHFGKSYADLSSVWSACRAALTKNGLAVTQIPSGEGRNVRLTTLLVHKSGQWMGGTSAMTSEKDSPQAVGSCLTYLRRYSLAALVGVAPEDDDGNAASDGGGREPIKGGVVDPQLEAIREIAEEMDWSRGQVQAFALKLGIKKQLDQMTQAEGKTLIGALTAHQIESRNGAAK